MALALLPSIALQHDRSQSDSTLFKDTPLSYRTGRKPTDDTWSGIGHDSQYMPSWQHALCSFGFARESEEHGSWIFKGVLERVESDEGIGEKKKTEIGVVESRETHSSLRPEPQVQSVPSASSLSSGERKIGKEAVSRVTSPYSLLDSTSSDGSLTPVHPTLSARLPAFYRAKTFFGTNAKLPIALRPSPLVASSLQHVATNDNEDEATASAEKPPMLQTSGLDSIEPVVSEQDTVAIREDTSMERTSERRRLQNRIAQRNFRNRLKTRLEALEDRVAETESTRSRDGPAEKLRAVSTTLDGLDPEVMLHQSTNESVDIRCVCGIENDRRFIIPCMQCGTWQHIACYYELAADVVELHECIQCVPREVNNHARDTLKRQADSHWHEGSFTSTTRSGKRPKTAGAESSTGLEDDDLSSVATGYTVPNGVEPRLSSKTKSSSAYTPGGSLKEWNRPETTNIVTPPPTVPHALSRTSHKIAEQGRRNRINIALLDMQKLLPETQLDALGPDEFAASSSSSKAAKVERAVEYIKELSEQIQVKNELLVSKDQELGRVKEENASLRQAFNAPGPIAPDFGFLQAPDSGMDLLAKGPLWPNCSDTPMQTMAVAAFRERQQQDISELENQSSQMENLAKGAESENRSLQARIMELMDELREARAEPPQELLEDGTLDGIALASLRATELNVLADAQNALQIDWTRVQRMLPDTWMWDVEFQTDCWICTPLEVDEPKQYPLTIAGAPVVLPVESRWPPMGGVNPPPDPRPCSSIDCRGDITVDVARDVFLTFEGSVGFYILISGFLQIIVPEEYDTEWASSHFPHKYGGLKVSYIPQTMEATMLPSTTETTQTRPTLNPQSSGLSNIFRQSRTSVASSNPMLKLNDFIEARPKAGHRKEKYAGRIGLQVMKDNSPYLIMSTHIITEAIMAKSHRDAIFGRGRDSFQKLDADWNEHVEVWAGNEKIGRIEESCDKGAEIYPNGFRHDITLIKPLSHLSVNDIVSPIVDLGWLNRESWSSLRQKQSATKILGPTENHRSAKTLKCSRPSEILVVGEGVFLNQTAAASSSKSLKDYDVSTWKDLISRALLYRVCPDFDPPNGYSGVALYADGTREDGTTGPGIVGFQSFVQRSGHVQNFNMEGPALDRRLQLGRVAFYGAFEVPGTLKRECTIV